MNKFLNRLENIINIKIKKIKGGWYKWNKLLILLMQDFILL